MVLKPVTDMDLAFYPICSYHLETTHPCISQVSGLPWDGAWTDLSLSLANINGEVHMEWSMRL